MDERRKPVANLIPASEGGGSGRAGQHAARLRRTGDCPQGRRDVPDMIAIGFHPRGQSSPLDLTCLRAFDIIKSMFLAFVSYAELAIVY
jgi:hypothetical protein